MTASHLHNCDKALFQLISEGDEAAFKVLYNKHVLAISRISFSLVKSEDVARDVVQDVFLKLWLMRDKLTEVLNPDLYIYRMTYNFSFNHIRKRLEQEKGMANMDGAQPLSNFSEDGRDIVDVQETKRVIVQAVNNLHPRSREIYQLSRVGGLKPQEIADQLNVSVQSVRNSLTRSLKLIRDYLRQHGMNIPIFLLLLQLPPFTG